MNASKNLRIVLNEDGNAIVTKTFLKNSRIFGTPEYKLWKEFRQDCPNAQMVTKTIKKNPDKRTNRNMTYENMRLYIKQQENADSLLKELDRQIALSKIEVSPYRAVLAWFEKTFEGHDGYKQYFAELASAKDAA